MNGSVQGKETKSRLKDFFNAGKPRRTVARGDSVFEESQGKGDLLYLKKGSIRVSFTGPLPSGTVVERRIKKERTHFEKEDKAGTLDNVQSSGLGGWIKGIFTKKDDEAGPSPSKTVEKEPARRVSLAGQDSVIQAPAVFGKSHFDIFSPRKVAVVADSPCELVQLSGDEVGKLLREPEFLSLLNHSYRKNFLTAQLANLPFFGALTPESAKFLTVGAERVNCQPGETIVRAGDKVNAFYVIRSGSVKVTQGQPNSEEKVRFFEPGSYFGENIPLLDLGLEVVEGDTVTPPDYVLRGGSKMFVLRRGFKMNGTPASDLQLKGPRMDKVFCEVKVKEGRPLLTVREGSLPVFVNGDEVRKKILSVGDEVRVGDYLLKCEMDLRGLRYHKYSCQARDFVQLIKLDRRTFISLCAKSPNIDVIFSRIRKERNRGVDNCLATRQQLNEMRKTKEKTV